MYGWPTHRLCRSHFISKLKSQVLKLTIFCLKFLGFVKKFAYHRSRIPKNKFVECNLGFAKLITRPNLLRIVLNMILTLWLKSSFPTRFFHVLSYQKSDNDICAVLNQVDGHLWRHICSLSQEMYISRGKYFGIYQEFISEQL